MSNILPIMRFRFLKSISFWGKAFFLTVVVLISWLIWSKFGTFHFVPLLIVGGGFVFLETRRQVLIDKALKEILKQGGVELKEKIPQLEAKRSLITAIFYLVRKMGLGKEPVPKFHQVHELADLGTDWIKKHLGKMMTLHEVLNPILLNSFLPPIKAMVHHSIKNKKVFVGASIGCGLARFEEKIAKYCNKQRFPSIIFATDANKDLILKTKKGVEKRGIKIKFQDSDQEINLQSIIDEVQRNRQSLIYFVPVKAENFHNLFRAGFKIDLVWFLQSREHTIEEHPEVFDQIKECAKEWIILETFRNWGVIIFGNLINWWISPIFATETEISITRNYTPQEWAKKKIGVIIKRFPYFCWVLSKGVYATLKESGFLGKSFGRKDQLITLS